MLRDSSGASRGWAFVRLQDARDTEHAKRELDGTCLALPSGRAGHSSEPAKEAPGQPGLLVRWSLDSHTLCVRDLGPGVTDQQLQDAFEQFGNLVSCRVEKTPPEFHSRSKVCAQARPSPPQPCTHKTRAVSGLSLTTAR